ncbi:MAG: cytochrome d ubiquinol oxidase subunit II [Phycisphaerae bacterium]|jgi:cytochrome d ubiquinol oxidase subunit II|nr:cytochrome d ubiquinol oxidase subunit II [Phycisphaerae bacterium]
MSFLQVIWSVLIAVLLSVYLLLDGFDLGVGVRYLFEKRSEDRRTLLNAVGPVWDGNEVWLLTGAGAVFAAFPMVYASIFSGLYLPLLLVLVALIFRAVSVEFRNQLPGHRWTGFWDIAFAVGSTLPALLLGVAMGNVLRGMPLDAKGNYTGTFLALLNPYSLLIGIVGLTMLTTHGGIYLMLKTSGDLAKRSRKWASLVSLVYLAGIVVAAGATGLTQEHLLANYSALPALWAIPALALVAIVLCCVCIRAGKGPMAFVMSSVAIGAIMASVSAGLFPNMIIASNDAAHSLTVANSSSSEYTLKIMLIMTCIGLPVVLAYTAWAYRTFGYKADANESY